ncbi:MAG: hypothetical protein ABJI96_07905, partial [Paracoccaceae bacterium]
RPFAASELRLVHTRQTLAMLLSLGHLSDRSRHAAEKASDDFGLQVTILRLFRVCTGLFHRIAEDRLWKT